MMVSLSNSRRFVLLVALSFSAFDRIYGDTVIFESSVLGETDLTILDMANLSIPGSNIGEHVFQGVKFHLDKPVLTTRIGGHFIATEGGGSFFGAIVTLADDHDFPNSANLSTPDVLGATQLVFPSSSEQVFGEVSLNLNPGWFALVFGSGLFSTSGKGAIVGNGIDISWPQYIGWQPSGPELGWLDYSNSPLGHHFSLLGNVVPEPTTFAMISIGALSWLFHGRITRKPGDGDPCNQAHDLILQY